MTDTDKLDEYIHNTFSKITDIQGQPVDLTLALPVLKQILTGYYHDTTASKFDYIGGSALQFAINLILAQKYSRYDNRVLAELARKFRVPLQLYKRIGKQLHLKEYARPAYLKEKMDLILGVLYHFYGIVAVQSIVEEAIVLSVDHELNNASSPKRVITPNDTDDNPIKILNEMIQVGNGAIEMQYSQTPEKKWKVNIIARFNDQSLLFSHARTNGSKQKAKTEASRDILTFFTNNPDVCQQLQNPGDGNTETHALPISENDFCQLFDENISAANSRRAIKTGDYDDDDDDLNCTHLPQDDHEEATLLLQNLLLESKMDIDMDPRQVKRQRQTSSTDFNGILHDSIAVKQEPSTESPTLGEQQQQHALGSDWNCMDVETFKIFNRTADLPVDEATAIRNEKIVKYFKKTFAPHRTTLMQCRTIPGQSKTLFMSFVTQHQDEMLVEISGDKCGENHAPLFHAKVVLRSKTEAKAFLITEGDGRKKKDAEQQAFYKMIEIITN